MVVRHTLIISILTATFAACGPVADEPTEEVPRVIITVDDDESTPTPEDQEQPQTEEPVEDPEEMEPPAEEPVELEPRTETVSGWTEGLTCESACAARDWVCDVNPERQGSVTYTKTTRNEQGDSFTTRETMVVEACDQEIPELYTEYEYYEPDHQFETARCPCLAEAVTKVQVDVANLVTCAEACTAEGLQCDPETPWTLGQESGGEAVYTTSDGTRYHPVACEEIPSGQISRGGRSYQLAELHCGCR